MLYGQMDLKENVIEQCENWYHKNNGEVNTKECFHYAFDVTLHHIIKLLTEQRGESADSSQD
jgi:hypothetical protein